MSIHTFLTLNFYTYFPALLMGQQKESFMKNKKDSALPLTLHHYPIKCFFSLPYCKTAYCLYSKIWQSTGTLPGLKGLKKALNSGFLNCSVKKRVRPDTPKKAKVLYAGENKGMPPSSLCIKRCCFLNLKSRPEKP